MGIHRGTAIALPLYVAKHDRRRSPSTAWLVLLIVFAIGAFALFVPVAPCPNFGMLQAEVSRSPGGADYLRSHPGAVNEMHRLMRCRLCGGFGLINLWSGMEPPCQY